MPHLRRAPLRLLTWSVDQAPRQPYLPRALPASERRHALITALAAVFATSSTGSPRGWSGDSHGALGLPAFDVAFLHGASAFLARDIVAASGGALQWVDDAAAPTAAGKGCTVAIAPSPDAIRAALSSDAQEGISLRSVGPSPWAKGVAWQWAARPTATGCLMLDGTAVAAAALPAGSHSDDDSLWAAQPSTAPPALRIAGVDYHLAQAPLVEVRGDRRAEFLRHALRQGAHVVAGDTRLQANAQAHGFVDAWEAVGSPAAARWPLNLNLHRYYDRAAAVARAAKGGDGEGETAHFEADTRRTPTARYQRVLVAKGLGPTVKPVDVQVTPLFCPVAGPPDGSPAPEAGAGGATTGAHGSVGIAEQFPLTAALSVALPEPLAVRPA